jgi:hypothetical protein
MTTSKALADPAGPEPGRQDRQVDLQAGAVLADWLSDHPIVARELEEAGQARVHYRELDAREQAARAAATDAARRAASVSTKVDPAGQRVMHPLLGGALVAGLVTLDIFPLNWAAQAFNMDAAASWLVTLILLAASVAAMGGLELTRPHHRRHMLLASGLVIACVALVLLRTEFIAVVTSEALSDAFLQSLLLTAISAGLVMSGSMVLSRTRSLRLARAHAASRRAQRKAEAADTAKALAEERLHRHLGALRQMLVPWALSSPAPAGVDRVSWTAALDRVVRQLFTGL